MAVLHLLLQQEPAARAKEGLEAVVTKHNTWLEGKKFLLVPYHMIGAGEHGVGHPRRLRGARARAPPGRADPRRLPGRGALPATPRELRETLGDEAFFERLNQSAASAGGAMAEAGATSRRPGMRRRFEAALEAPPGSTSAAGSSATWWRQFFQAYQDVARGSQEAFVSLDDGLSIISRHAQALGYDALVLFLDELILWLASHAADQAFVNREGPKLVEARRGRERRIGPIPIVSFVARQRDLRELVGENIPGAEQLGFADVLQLVGGALRHHHARGPEPAGDRRATRASAPRAKRRASRSTQAFERDRRRSARRSSTSC